MGQSINVIKSVVGEDIRKRIAVVMAVTNHSESKQAKLLIIKGLEQIELELKQQGKI
jgi:hypothetical protein